MANISGYLSNIKNAERGEDVRDSIINALQKINDDNPSIVKPLNITSNGTYAGEGGIVYNPVTVNVPEGAASALTLTDKVITENGEYEADDGEAYRSVTVDVPQEMNDIMEEKVVTENGEYTALLDGYDGYAKVTVNVQQGNTGPHTVRFHDASGAVVQTVVNVPYGGGCVYSGPTPTSSGMRFVGFNPNPSNVKTDLDCYPKFVNYAIGANQIEDTWETIVDNILYHFDVAQEKYKVGDWKMLEIPVDSAWRKNDSATLHIKCTLVAYHRDVIYGNNGYAKTTWITSPFKTYWNPDTSDPNYDSNIALGRGGREHTGWDLHPVRAWLNAPLDKLAFTKYFRSYNEKLYDSIQTVVKRSHGCSYTGDTRVTTDKFWIPSSYEIFGGKYTQTFNEVTIDQPTGNYTDKLEDPGNGLTYSDYFQMDINMSDSDLFTKIRVGIADNSAGGFPSSSNDNIMKFQTRDITYIDYNGYPNGVTCLFTKNTNLPDGYNNVSFIRLNTTNGRDAIINMFYDCSINIGFCIG